MDRWSSKSYCAAGNYREALPLLNRVDAYLKKNNPEAPGQQLQISAAYGCLKDRTGATSRDEANLDYALDYLRKLNVKYDKRPTLFRYPIHTVKQLLGELSFEDALEGAANKRSLSAAFEVARPRELALPWLGIALFHDGVLHRVHGDEAACAGRMKQVLRLGYQTDSIRWQLARYGILVTAG